MDKLLIIETDSISDIANECYNLNWEPVFVETKNYKNWLPYNKAVEDYDVTEVMDLSFYDIIKYAKLYNVSSILPLSLLEPECVRDALTKNFIEQKGLPYRIIANSPNTVEFTYDKLLTKEILEEYNIPLVPYRVPESNEHLEKIVKEFGYPFIIKSRKGYTGHGIRLINNNESLRLLLNRSNIKDSIIEPFIEGSEVSVEMVSWKENTIIQPMVYKGETRAKIFEHPAYRPRISPWKKNTALEVKMHEIVKKINSILDFKGAVEFEFIISNNNPLLLEINPRISGVTRLCNAAGGINVYRTLAHLAITNSLPNVSDSRQKYAMQFPLTILPTGDLFNDFLENRNVSYIKSINWMPILSLKSNIIISYDTLDELTKGVYSFKEFSNNEYLEEANHAIINSI